MTETEKIPDTNLPTAGEKRVILLIAALALLFANLPYLIGLIVAPHGATFTGLTFNIDDGAVYLSWIRQAAEGNFFLHNRFTTEPQQGLVFNLFFLLLGTICRVTHLSASVVYAVARVVCGGLLLGALWQLVTLVLPDRRARLLAFALLCFAAGFGFGSDFDPAHAYEQPIDRWQPEAITFLSLYYTPLFSAALACMAVFVTSFLKAERSRKMSDLWPALLMGFLLGNFHSYDILQLFLLAAIYRIVSDGQKKAIDIGGWLRLIAVGAAMLPTAGYQFWALQHEAVFHARAFDTSTLSPSLVWVLAGFGLPLVLAVVLPLSPMLRKRLPKETLLLLLLWGGVAIAISYAPHVSFQRKLLMGAHLPICLLAGAALAGLTERLSGGLPGIVAVAAVLITVPSNLRFVLADIVRLRQNIGATQYRPYLEPEEAGALHWLDSHVQPGEGVLVSPDMKAHLRGGPALMPYLGVFVPVYSSGTVYCAHWSETARFAEKLSDTHRFFRATTTDEERAAFLSANSGIHYVVYSNDVKEGLRTADGEWINNETTGQPLYVGVDWSAGGSIPSFLQPVYNDAAITIFLIKKPTADVPPVVP